MQKTAHRDKAWLVSTARAVAETLKPKVRGTGIRVRLPSAAVASNTDGWSALIGDLGRGQPQLQIWLDRFTAYPDRKLSASLYTYSTRKINSIINRVDKKYFPVRVITPADTEDEGHLTLANHLPRSQFNAPILEKYPYGITFLAIYDLTRQTRDRVNTDFVHRAAGFFADIAESLSKPKKAGESEDLYPRYENRKRVATHILRERSRLLAADCKTRDSYVCQVCSMEFGRMYGALGNGFAEAHHKVPLSKLRDGVKTQLSDLVTVCSNCHRMLHRMDGVATDVSRLRRIVRNRSRATSRKG
jgi:5-methylcytosine-specific restriction endonuclease McrA